MKANELPSDDELRTLIRARYGPAIGLTAKPSIIGDFRLGTKPLAPWKRQALFAVNEERANGASITTALRTVYEEHRIHQVANSSFASFKRSYEKFRKEELRYYFSQFILDGEIEDAIEALKFCHDSVRSEILSDLTKEMPPPSPA
jgi:hypothetical protein